MKKLLKKIYLNQNSKALQKERHPAKLRINLNNNKSFNEEKV